LRSFGQTDKIKITIISSLQSTWHHSHSLIAQYLHTWQLSFIVTIIIIIIIIIVIVMCTHRNANVLQTRVRKNFYLIFFSSLLMTLMVVLPLLLLLPLLSKWATTIREGKFNFNENDKMMDIFLFFSFRGKKN
jgi:hypothetical protein